MERIPNKAERLANTFLNWLFPARCAMCRKLTEDGSRLCPECRKNLPYTKGNAQRQKFRYISCCLSPLYYVDDVRESLLRYKFSDCTGYADVYGEFIAKCIDENEISCDIITWVPLSRQRLRSRGYDQAQLIAQAVAKRVNLPCVRLLKKVVDNPAQSGTGNKEKREKNVAGVYECINDDLIRDRHILLIDDIVTTGSTLSECARMLRNAGAADILAASAARKKDW